MRYSVPVRTMDRITNSCSTMNIILRMRKPGCGKYYSFRANIQGSLRRRKYNAFHSCVVSNTLIPSTSVNANLLPISTKVLWFGLQITPLFHMIPGNMKDPSCGS